MPIYIGAFFISNSVFGEKCKDKVFQNDHKANDDIRAFIQKTPPLSFVPVSFVRIAWNATKATTPQDAQVQEYSDYFQLTWLNGNFRLQLWNYFYILVHAQTTT